MPGKRNHARQYKAVDLPIWLEALFGNAECPNLLIRRRLNQTIEQAYRETGRRVHLIGHSLGGVLARSVAGDQAERIASIGLTFNPAAYEIIARRLAESMAG